MSGRGISKRRAYIIRWSINLAAQLAREAPGLDYYRACDAFAPFGNRTYTARVLRECMWRALRAATEPDAGAS